MGFMSDSFYKKNSQSSGRGEARPSYPKDRLVCVDEYLGDGKMIVCDKRNGFFMVEISPEAIARCRKSESFNAKFFGHLIDERMERHIPVGRWIVLEKCLFVRKVKVGDKTMNLFQANRVINFSDDSDCKLFEAVITIEEREGRVMSAQAWNYFAYDAFKDNSLMYEVFEKGYDGWQKGLKLPRNGFMLRIVNDENVVIDSVYPIDAVKNDETGKYEPVSPSWLRDTINQYAEYAKENGLVGEIEVCLYVSYVGSTQSKHLEVKSMSPLHKLATRGVILSTGNKPVSGKVWAVGGILQLSGDVADQKTKTFVERNIATNIFANGPQGDIRRWVTRPDGTTKVKLHESLAFSEKQKEV